MRNNASLKLSEKVVITTCASHCGGSCILQLHINDGVITRIETDDGELLLLGSLEYHYDSDPNPEYYDLVIKTDQDGNVLWFKSYDIGLWDDTFTEIKQVIDGNYVIVGKTWKEQIPGGYVESPMALKIDEDGNKIWSNIVSFDPYVFEEFHTLDFIETPDNKIILAEREEILNSQKNKSNMVD